MWVFYQSPMEIDTMSAIKSKWGFHPCGYETFMKLKSLQKLYQDALRRKAAWERWERKLPENRISRKKIRNSAGQVVGFMAPQPLPEPELNNLLEKVEYTTHQDRSGQYSTKPHKRERVVLRKFAELILADYRNARFPVSAENQVRPLKLSEDQIDALCKLL